jgi:hypothetical protein
MPVLDRLNERWVTDFERKLGELIRQPLEVTLQEVQLAPYGNWLAALPVPTSLNLYTVKPWPRNALVAVDGKLLFTLAPPTNDCCIILKITNNGSAGAITTSGFTGVFGDSFTTTDTDVFLCTIIKLDGTSSLTVQDVS